MSNPTDTEYDRQFQDDIERATALSMETLALDQFRRNRLQYSHSDVSSSAAAVFFNSNGNYSVKTGYIRYPGGRYDNYIKLV